MPAPKVYKNWTITPSIGTQLGYSTPHRLWGRGRKIKGYEVTHPEHRPQPKWCDTLAEARDYIDSWDDSPAPESKTEEAP